ncbi:hypothetical protein HUF15_31865 [Streptomyces samsunensis]|uniref:hypothetical protein n=1 Tax=Streptomyces malaysiensis TaxID=92644 RepID=UPI0015815A69|nr:hypothetical protein [Streptomyces samsunensis]NUH41283.1 hypothetical protein [Streptomyces samsunensis]
MALGVALPLVVDGPVRLSALGAEAKLQPLLPPATGVIQYATCHLTHAHPYLAFVSAGAVLASVSLDGDRSFEPLGEAVAELSKSADLLAFGALLTAAAVRGPDGVRGRGAGHGPGPPGVDADVSDRHPFARREKPAAAWFGPKGFTLWSTACRRPASGIRQGEEACALIAVCIMFSIAASQQHGHTRRPPLRHRGTSSARSGPLRQHPIPAEFLGGCERMLTASAYDTEGG